MNSAIQDLSLWKTLHKKDKIKAIETLCSDILQASFHFRGELIGNDELGLLYHEATGTEFILVPGGSLLMGFAIDDIFSFWQSVDHAEMSVHEHTETYESARPARHIHITPFLVSREAGVNALQEIAKENDWNSSTKPMGLDLLNDAEWEWCAREGGVVRFVCVPAKLKITVEDDFEFNEESGWGLRNLLHQNQKLQGIAYENFADVPLSNKAWTEAADSSRVFRYVHTMWQSTGECIAAHAAYRFYPQEDDGVLRWVYRLPDLSMQEPLNKMRSYENLLAALRSGKGKGLKSALYTLEELTVFQDGLKDLAEALPDLLTDDIVNQKSGVIVLSLLAKCLGPKTLFEYDKSISSEVSLLDTSNLESRLLELIAINDTKIRMSAICLASAFKPSNALVQKLSDILKTEKKNLELSISAAITLGVYAKFDANNDIETLLRDGLKDKNAQLRGACACALAYVHGIQKLNDSTTDLLIETLSLPDKYSNKMLFFSGSLSKGAISLLKKGPKELRIKVAQHVLNQIRTIDAPKVAQVALLLSLVFEASHTPQVSRELHTVNELEKEVLLQISKHEITDYFTLEKPILALYGIPEMFITRRLWLGLEDSPYASNTLLNIKWEGKDCHWPIWKHAEYLQINSIKDSKEYEIFSEALNSLPYEVLVSLSLEPQTVLIRNNRWANNYSRFLSKEKVKVAHEEIVQSNPEVLMSIYIKALKHFEELNALGYSVDSDDSYFIRDLDEYLPKKMLLTDELLTLYFQLVAQKQIGIHESLFKRIEKSVLKQKMQVVAQDWIREETTNFEELRSHGRAEDIASAGIFLKDLELMTYAMRLDGRSAWHSVKDMIEKAAANWSELKELHVQLVSFRSKAKSSVSSGDEMARKVLAEFSIN
jgi:hypothetical protein